MDAVDLYQTVGDMGSAGDHVAADRAATVRKHQTLTPTSGRQALAEADGNMDEKAADIVAHSFLIPAAEVRRTLTLRGMSEDALLRSLIVPASKLARPYVSKFYVGCEP